MSYYKLWIGHVKTSNLSRVEAVSELLNHGDGINFQHQLELGEETPVECLRIVDIAQRPQFHFIARVQE